MRKRPADIVDLFSSITDRVEMERLFGEIFTPAELRAFELRWKLLEELSEGRAQREIAHDLGISLCKITRGAKLLKKEDGVLRRVFETKTKENAT